MDIVNNLLESDANESVVKWAKHWDEKASIENPIELNGYCVNGKPLSQDFYHNVIIKPNLEILGLEPYHKVLEIGCGSGLILKELEAQVAEAIGTDISKTMLSRFTGKSRTILCPADKLPFEKEQFDRLLMIGVAIYFPSLDYFKLVVTKGLSILRSGGIFLIGDLLLGQPSSKSQYTYYDKHELIDFLDVIGFPYTIAVQNRLKRSINQRHDIIIYKD